MRGENHVLHKSLDNIAQSHVLCILLVYLYLHRIEMDRAEKTWGAEVTCATDVPYSHSVQGLRSYDDAA